MNIKDIHWCARRYSDLLYSCIMSVVVVVLQVTTKASVHGWLRNRLRSKHGRKFWLEYWIRNHVMHLYSPLYFERFLVVSFCILHNIKSRIYSRNLAKFWFLSLYSSSGEGCVTNFGSRGKRGLRGGIDIFSPWSPVIILALLIYNWH